MYFRRVVITENGVYQPLALVPRLVIYVCALLAIAAGALFGRIPLATAGLYFALLGVPFGLAMYTYRKYGKLGRPSVSLVAGVVSIDRPQRADGMLSFPLAQLQEILVYGHRGRRAYRFVNSDGAIEEVTPLWGRKIEVAVIEFLLGRVGTAVKVTVEEPHTLFASIRGDKAV